MYKPYKSFIDLLSHSLQLIFLLLFFLKIVVFLEIGTAMNTRSSENYLTISSKSYEIFGPRYIRDDFFRAESSLIQSSCRSFIRVIVPYEISKVNFRVETKILVSMSEEI